MGAVKIIVLGEEGEAKSRFMEQASKNYLKADPDHKIGVDLYVNSVTFDYRQYYLQFYVLDLEERFRFMWPGYMEGATAGIVIYDAGRPESIWKMDSWLSLLRENLGSAPIALIGLKSTAEEDAAVEEAVITAKMQEYYITDSFLVAPTTRKNAEAVIEQFARKLLGLG